MHCSIGHFHNQGVANTLADVKVQFNDLTQEHQKMVDQFKVNIDNLESVYTNATKSAKYVNCRASKMIRSANSVRLTNFSLFLSFNPWPHVSRKMKDWCHCKINCKTCR